MRSPTSPASSPAGCMRARIIASQKASGAARRRSPSPTSTISSSGSRSASSSAAAPATCCSTIFRTSPRIRWRFSRLWTGGMSFHGGIIGCIVATVVFALRRGMPILSLGDVTLAVCPIGLFLGRLANFINGELWGRPTDVPWAMIFPDRRSDPAPSEPALRSARWRAAAVRRSRHYGAARRAQAARSDHRHVRGRLRMIRIFCEVFREPDAQLGFLWGGLTMGMLLCDPADRSPASACWPTP